ncbi:MAG: hypothetical protein XD49_1805 [Caldanaerobacter subterraneus]|jgi:methyl-galactoside transport system substrate-binding protein|uniref:D-galactose/methyl-galactoside binding periplasmic protein MglB n=1 Tax=Caldanaerobacter subterraneus TaxID=911092 RepID=A0A101E460_9THEO|nr:MULTISPECIES: galactose ABC transporter substrate-binding protein [Caldanaerobacter]KUK08147.1 MAG: hypothetical protein XD49_1805 [Caldanaerobacter subterraneus]MDI3518517.1 methyl-galactoside transport system substrate-binding protein [Caldanaerobacter sp.]HBT48967.1 galactose/glucose ABC transporter substrate-binding protein MglB [Caldanaerobacter subterraneus]
MKKIFTYLILMVFITTIVLAGCGSSQTSTTEKEKLPVIGVAIYKFDDTFMTSVRDNIAKAAEGKAKVDIVDCQNSQPVQNDKIDLFITKKVDALIVNPVDRTAAGTIIEKAKAANIPVVFINREPLPEDMQKWDKVYYVGAKAEQSGILQGEIMAEYWKSHPEADKNHDGVMQYVMLTGEPGHQDAELRTKYSIQTVQEAGIKVQELARDTAMWDRVKGQDKMAAFLAAHGDKIEAVFANNDDMALGAIEALKAAGYFKNGKYIPVVGVDATVPGVQALKEGTLLGTVLNDAKNQGKAAFMLAYILAQGKTPTKENVGYDITDGKYIWIPYVKVTLDNVDEVIQ